MRRLQDFRRVLHLAVAAVFVLAVLMLSACNEDEPKVDPVTVQFTTSAQTITEDGGAKKIMISLGSAAKKDGVLTVSASPANAGTIALFDTEINVTKGNTSAQFTVTPLNNAIIDENVKVITFTLEDPTSGFELGEQTTQAVTITDDEGPATANFTIASATLAENASAGIEVEIILSPAADVAGSIEVTITPAAATVTTTPVATAGKIIIPVAVGQATALFTVIPNDNEVDDDDYEVAFEITGVTGGVVKGTNVEYTLTVDDDDDIVPVPIADIRAMYSTADVEFSADIYVKAIVTSVSAANGNIHQNGVYVQEETGGAILLFFTGAHNFTRGDVVQVNLKGGKLTNFNGLLEITDIPVANAANAKMGTDDLPAYTTVTVEQFLAADRTSPLQSKLVKIENVSFPLADGTLTMNGTRTFTDGTNSGAMFTRAAASFSGSMLPLGSGTIQGILSNNTNVVQLLPQVFASDLFANNPVGTIGITGTLGDFGSVNNGAESAEQSYSIQGTTLTNDIVVTASTGYLVSLTSGGTFGSTVTIPAANANTATTVYVKFSPSTGANQAVNGTLTHKSQGAATVIVNVTGTEAGNVGGTGTLMIYEVYGGGGNAGATYKNDYVVLYNGTAASIDLSAYSLQYASSGSTADFGPTNIATLSGTIDAGGYFLIQLAAGAGNGADLPTPDLIGNPALALSATNGKIALVLGSTAISSTAVTHANVVDFVGFGSSNAFEGTAAVGVLSNSTSAKRNTFVDTNKNSTDFTVGIPNLNYL